jgi:transcriptional regulator with XRE-family HTH domain
MMTFDLAAWRQWVGLSQRELAGMAGLSGVAIAELERNHRLPRPSTLAAIARALGVPRTTLLHSSPSGVSTGWHPARIWSPLSTTNCW